MFSYVMENSQQKGCLLHLIASWNFIACVICANDASNQSCRIYSREIFRMRETVYLIKGVLQKKCGRLIPDNEITS